MISCHRDTREQLFPDIWHCYALLWTVSSKGSSCEGFVRLGRHVIFPGPRPPPPDTCPCCNMGRLRIATNLETA